MDTARIHEQPGEGGELTIRYCGEEFILQVSGKGYEVLTADHLPIRYAYPASPKTGRAYSVGNVEPQKLSEGFYGCKSEGWKAPQLKGPAADSPEGAAVALISWLEHKTGRRVA